MEEKEIQTNFNTDCIDELCIEGGIENVVYCEDDMSE